MPPACCGGLFCGYIADMKAPLLLAFTVVMLGNIAIAQQGIQTNSLRKIQENPPLVLIDNMETNFNYLVINPNSIEKIEVLKDGATIKALGDRGRNGAIFITTKQNSKIFRLDAILDKYHIESADRQLQICIDKILVKDTSKILVDDTEIERVEITNDRIYNFPVEQDKGEKFINIVTRKTSQVKR